MANLTKEYFDKKLESLATKKDLSVLATKKDLEKEIQDLAGMMARRFDEVERKLDVREEVEKLKSQMKQVREALSL